MRDSTQEKAYRYIKELIISFQVKPNDQLVAATLADELAISRTPVREALSRLEQEGLVERAGGWGYTVRELRLSDVEELFKVRESLELMAVAAAIEHIDDLAISELEALLERAAACQRSPAKFISFNRAFYSLITASARNELLRNMLALINDRVQMIGSMTVRYHAARVLEILNENRALLDALKGRDRARAEGAVRNHIGKGRDYAIHMLARARLDEPAASMTRKSRTA